MRILKDDQIEFFKNNPQKATLEQWQYIAYEICIKSNIKVSSRSISREQCNLALEITKETITPDCLVTLQLIKELEDCDKTQIKLTRTHDQCKTDWEILMSKYTDCNISLREYYDLYNTKNVTFDMLDSLYANGVIISLQEGKIIFTGTIDSYKIEEVECYDSNLATASGSYKAFLRKITEDLNISQDLKTQLGL